MVASGAAANETDQPSLDVALAEVQTLLERDGFTASWDLDEQGGLRFRVGATDTACIDCLVPKPVIEAILADALEGTGHHVAEVSLPGTD